MARADGKRTFLELCNLAASFTGDHGVTERASIEEFTGDLFNLPRYITNAWEELCNSRPDWNFLREDNYITQPLREGMSEQETRHLLGNDYENFSHWNEHGQFRTIWDGVEESFSSLAKYEWIRERTYYPENYGFVTYIAIMPSMDLYVYGAPPKGFTVCLRCDWFRRANQLLVDGDVMNLPRQHEMAVVYRALCHYYQSTDDLNRYEIALRDYSSARAQIMYTQRPTPTFELPREY